MSGVYGYSKTAASNTSVGGISIAEGMNPANVNDADRADLTDTAKWRDDTSGALTSGGSANAQTLTTNSTITAYADGQRFHFVAGFTTTTSATLNVDSVGAKAIRKGADLALGGREILIGGHYIVQYDASANGGGGAWMLLNPEIQDNGEITSFTLTCSSPGDLSITYNSRSCKWYRIGDLVFFDLTIDFDTNAFTTPSGAALLDEALPYNADGAWQFTNGRCSHISEPGSTRQLGWDAADGTKDLYFFANRDGATNTGVGFGSAGILASKSNAIINISGCYRTDEAA